MLDIYEIRSLLEGLCARWATEKITKEKIEELEEIILLSEFHLSKEHYDEMPVTYAPLFGTIRINPSNSS